MQFSIAFYQVVTGCERLQDTKCFILLFTGLVYDFITNLSSEILPFLHFNLVSTLWVIVVIKLACQMCIDIVPTFTKYKPFFRNLLQLYGWPKC